MKNQLLDTLLELGLTENEANIYLAALSLGVTSVQKLALNSGVKRTTVYSVVESLKQKGLITAQLQGFKNVLAAEDPAKLESVLEIKREKLRETLPDFAAMYNLKKGEESIRYYEGLGAIKSVYEQLLKDIRPNEDYMVMGNMEAWTAQDKDFFTEFTRRRGELSRKINFRIRILIQDTPLGREAKLNEKKFNFALKILPTETKLSTNLIIIPKKLFVHQVVPPLFGMTIENKSIIQMQREMYEMVWNSIK